MNGEGMKEQAAKLRNCDREYMTEQMSKGRSCNNPDSKVHGANMGPTWVPLAPDGPHVGSINLAIKEMHDFIKSSLSVAFKSPDSKPEYFMYARPQQICTTKNHVLINCSEDNFVNNEKHHKLAYYCPTLQSKIIS